MKNMSIWKQVDEDSFLEAIYEKQYFATSLFEGKDIILSLQSTGAEIGRIDFSTKSRRYYLLEAKG